MILLNSFKFTAQTMEQARELHQEMLIELINQIKENEQLRDRCAWLEREYERKNHGRPDSTAHLPTFVMGHPQADGTEERGGGTAESNSPPW